MSASENLTFDSSTFKMSPTAMLSTTNETFFAPANSLAMSKKRAQSTKFSASILPLLVIRLSTPSLIVISLKSVSLPIIISVTLTETSFLTPSIVKVVVNCKDSGKMFSSLVTVVSFSMLSVNITLSSITISSTTLTVKLSSSTMIWKFSNAGKTTLIAVKASALISGKFCK